MDAFKIVTPGSHTTIQDSGRFGFQNMGVPVSGVLDQFSFAAANILVGNPENTPVIELTVMGPSIEIFKEMDVALTGADMEMKINGRTTPQWQSVRVSPGDDLTIGQIKTGCRGYLAVGGGMDITRVMGSCSTYAGAKIGGFKGRPLKSGDHISIYPVQLLEQKRVLPDKYIPVHSPEITLRIIPGPQDDYFSSMDTLTTQPYTITPKADRMGYRLSGEPIHIREDMPKSIVSEPSMPGSIQIPPDEQPIILLVEQTVGGYAKIATVISTDIRKVAQAFPGNTIRFKCIDLDTAHDIFRKEKQLAAEIRELF